MESNQSNKMLVAFEDGKLKAISWFDGKDHNDTKDFYKKHVGLEISIIDAEDSTELMKEHWNWGT